MLIAQKFPLATVLKWWLRVKSREASLPLISQVIYFFFYYYYFPLILGLLVCCLIPVDAVCQQSAPYAATSSVTYEDAGRYKGARAHGLRTVHISSSIIKDVISHPHVSEDVKNKIPISLPRGIWNLYGQLRRREGTHCLMALKESSHRDLLWGHKYFTLCSLSASGLRWCELPHPRMSAQASFLLQEPIPVSPAVFPQRPRQVMISFCFHCLSVQFWKWSWDSLFTWTWRCCWNPTLEPLPAPKKVCQHGSKRRDLHSFMPITWGTPQGEKRPRLLCQASIKLLLGWESKPPRSLCPHCRRSRDWRWGKVSIAS